IQHPRRTPISTLFPYTTLFRSQNAPLDLARVSGRLTFTVDHAVIEFVNAATGGVDLSLRGVVNLRDSADVKIGIYPSVPIYLLRSEEHTSELQSRFDLVCRLLL